VVVNDLRVYWGPKGYDVAEWKYNESILNERSCSYDSHELSVKRMNDHRRDSEVSRTHSSPGQPSSFTKPSGAVVSPKCCLTNSRRKFAQPRARGTLACHGECVLGS